MLKLRFETPKGLLTVEQLFDLSMTDLSTTIKKVNALIKKEQATDDELSFLEGVDTTETQNSLRFRILKDVYLTKKDARDAAALDFEKKQRNQRIAEALDKIYMEKGGGGNCFESYTVAWYMGLKRTKLDCFDKQGRKGIIITMGDEPLNPYLPKGTLNRFVRATEERDIETTALLKEVSRKFDVFHIAVDDPASAYRFYEGSIKRSFSILGERFKVSTIDNLSKAIVDCISASISAAGAATEEAEADMPPKNVTNDKGEITW